MLVGAFMDHIVSAAQVAATCRHADKGRYARSAVGSRGVGIWLALARRNYHHNAQLCRVLAEAPRTATSWPCCCRCRAARVRAIEKIFFGLPALNRKGKKAPAREISF